MTGKYKAYPEYKNTGVLGLEEIPVDWELKRIKFLFDIGRGRVISEQELVNEGLYPVYSSQTKNNGCLGYINTYDFDCEQITWTTDGANAGTVFLRKGKHNCTNVCGTLRPRREDETMGFTLYCLEYVTPFHKRPDTNGAKIMNNEMAEISISHPPFLDREKIANFLDHETAKIDTLIDKQQQLIQLLKEKRQAVISHAVTKGLNPNAPMRDSGFEWLGDIPVGWKLMNLGWFSDIRRGSGYQNINMNTDQADETVSMLRISDIHTIDPVKIVKTDEVMRYTVAENDILVAGTGATAGISTIINKKDHGLVHSYNSIKVRIENSKISNQFVQYYLCSDYVLGLLDVSFSGSAQHFVDINGLSKLKILIPDFSEQSKIVCYLNQQLSKLEVLEYKALSFIMLLQERRTALISAAVTGKIDVRHWQAPAPTQSKEAV